jgi:hypothetical protein
MGKTNLEKLTPTTIPVADCMVFSDRRRDHSLFSGTSKPEFNATHIYIGTSIFYNNVARMRHTYLTSIPREASFGAAQTAFAQRSSECQEGAKAGCAHAFLKSNRIRPAHRCG